MKLLRTIQLLMLLVSCVSIQAVDRAKLNFNSEWKLCIGDVARAENTDYEDSRWQQVTLPSPEPTYSKIYDGEWLDDTLPYHVIHRIASNPEAHGIFSTIMNSVSPTIQTSASIPTRIIGSCSTTSKSMALPIVVSSTLSMEMSDLLIRN